MKDKDFETPFPWTVALLLCSLCFFGFIRVMKYLNVELPPLFSWIGTGALALGCISGLVLVAFRNKKRDRSKFLNSTSDPE